MFKDIKNTIGWVFSLLMIFGLVFFLAIQTAVFYQLISSDRPGVTGLKGDQIGVLKIEGGIFDVEKSLNILRQYEKRDNIKAVLLDVNSPGGAVAPSQELSQAVARISEGGKPVIASVRSVGASGAYYVASSADTIIANEGSMVGSIGVMVQFFKFKDLVDKIGIEYEIVKSGEYKDLGSPFRDMRADEREILLTLIMDVYDQFIGHIQFQRPHFSREELEDLADGRIFTGRQADEMGLIDMTGTYRDAVRVAADAAGIKGEPRLVDLSRDRLSIFHSASSKLNVLLDFLGSRDQSSFRLLYMMPEYGFGANLE